MKYIKIFEEFFGGYNSLKNKEKIEELIELCFAELTDEDFRVAISERNISISKMESHEIVLDRLFNYNVVEDHLIPFVKLLSKDYDIDHIFFLGDWKKKSWLDKKIDNFKGSGPSGSRERKEVSVEDLISDKAKINFQLISITIKIK
jgi:hypothetical protein